MGLFVLHAEGKAAECFVGVGRGRESGERQWGRVNIEIAAMTLCEPRSAVHPGDVSESPCSQVDGRRFVFQDNGTLLYDLLSLV